MKYTVIYSDFFMSGGHRHSIVRMVRINLTKHDTIESELRRLNIEMTQVNFVFIGWPELEGE